EQRRVREDFLAAERLGYPERRHTERLELASVCALVVGAETFGIEAPHTDGTELPAPGANVVRDRACRCGHGVKRMRGARLMTSTRCRPCAPSAARRSLPTRESAISLLTSAPWHNGANGRRRSMPSSR